MTQVGAEPSGDTFSIFEAVRDGSGRIVDMRWVHASPATLALLHRSAKELIGRGLLEVIPSLRGSDHFASYVRTMETGEPTETVVADLPELPGAFGVRLVKLGADIVATASDVIGSDLPGWALAESERRFRLSFEDTQIGMVMLSVDPEAPVRFLRVNKAAARMFGYSQQQLLDIPVAELVPQESAGDFDRLARELQRGERDGYVAEGRYRHASGRLPWIRVSVLLVRDESGRPSFLLGQGEEITARKESERELVHQALCDPLTGLPNRAVLLDHLEQSLVRARRTGKQVAVLFLDLDSFKTVNDSYGHYAGDRLLVTVAERLRRCERSTDIVSRLAGDEFVLVCEDLAGPDQVQAVARRVIRAFAAEIPIDGHSIKMTASIGIALSAVTSDGEQLLRAADAAMYEAKRGGGDRWSVAGATTHALAWRRLTTDVELRSAFDRQELRLWYQPVVDLRSEEMFGVEALLRWQHPERGVLEPSEFLDVAEDAGLIAIIGEWTLETACAQDRPWERRFGVLAPRMAVNVSSRQLGGHQVSNKVRAMLACDQLRPDRICLEITEAQVLAATDPIIEELTGVASLGVGLAIDDCGSGSAGFGYLRRFPASVLKIDQSLVAKLGQDVTDTAITASVIALGRNLGLTVVAVGVETTQQRDMLRDMGCHQGQGLLWSEAVPADELTRRLEEAAPATPTGPATSGRA